MAISFNERFDQHAGWRRASSLRLKLLIEWLKDHELMDAAVEERLRRLEARVRADKVMVAFVAEFSRGKSELINAIFFAAYGRRIMPAGAGRTTMCPTEMAYDADVPPCLRLLPIETRSQPQSLMEWRMVPEKWTRLDLDVNNPKQLSLALEKVAETRRVTPQEASALGFWQVEASPDNPPVDAQGLVEIPRWRHALINIAHPLLKQGLVILDTPGLNAVGAEPELTVSLIAQAHAVVFLLAADTGVTQSDLAIWREHVATDSDDESTRLVILNKIDTLWDALSSQAEIQAQIESQRAATAEILGIAVQQVIALSAQKGLVAKVTNDAALLEQSHLAAFEQALGQGIMGQRQKVLSAAVFNGITSLRAETGRVIHTRQRDLTEQLMELKGLHDKNAVVIKNMRARIAQEQAEFDLGGAKIHAVRSVHLKLLRQVFRLLGPVPLKKEMLSLGAQLRQKGLKLGVKQAYGQTFERLREKLRQVQAINAEIESMLVATFRQFNTEYGFSLQVPPEPSLTDCLHDLDLVEQSHLQYLGIGNIFRLAQSEFTNRLVRALSTRLRVIQESALTDIELWNKAAAAQLDAQLRDRHRNYGRRLDAMDRIQQASGGLEDRIAEIEAQQQGMNQLNAKLLELTQCFVTATDPGSSALATALESV